MDAPYPRPHLRRPQSGPSPIRAPSLHFLSPIFRWYSHLLATARTSGTQLPLASVAWTCGSDARVGVCGVGTCGPVSVLVPLSRFLGDCVLSHGSRRSAFPVLFIGRMCGVGVMLPLHGCVFGYALVRISLHESVFV